MARLNNPGALRAQLMAEGNRAAGEQVRRGTRLIFTRSQILCPVDSGLLRSTGSMQFRASARGPVGKVSYTAKYAAAVNDGARARIIRPRRKQFLRFVIDGRVIYAREVRWPGTRPRPFLTRAAQEVARANGWVYRRL